MNLVDAVVDRLVGQGDVPVGTDPQHVRRNFGMAIVVLDRGFVLVGEAVSDGDWMHIKNARSIIRWGTTKALAELANSGPLQNTKLGAASDAIAPMSSVVFVHSCKPGAWS